MIAECWLEANLNIHHRSYLLRLKNFSQQKSILDRLIEALEIRSLPISLDREGQAEKEDPYLLYFKSTVVKTQAFHPN
jgi:hypothetical protein